MAVDPKSQNQQTWIVPVHHRHDVDKNHLTAKGQFKGHRSVKNTITGWKK